ncbi:MAG: hypothetical protein ACUVSX_06845 [Aggregatilineales bacterium]
MSVALATTYHPRGEIGRLEKLYSALRAVYSDVIISLPPTAANDDVARLQRLSEARVFVNADWSHGRYAALKAALESGSAYIHYADMDRLIRWVETRPAEWRAAVERVQQCDCLVIGRTESAWSTHPCVMIQVEHIINRVFSDALGQTLDFGAGSKGFSRGAASFIIANSRPGRAIGTDAEWPVLAHRGGFRVEGMLVNGLDWEIPDQHQDAPASAERQRQMAAAYDADAAHWAQRVQTTIEVIEAGLDALRRPLAVTSSLE